MPPLYKPAGQNIGSPAHNLRWDGKRDLNSEESPSAPMQHRPEIMNLKKKVER